MERKQIDQAATDMVSRRMMDPKGYYELSHELLSINLLLLEAMDRLSEAQLLTIDRLFKHSGVFDLEEYTHRVHILLKSLEKPTTITFTKN